MSNQARLEARFALATFYYALDGDDWVDDMNFLSNFHECNWASDTSDQGVMCNDDQELISLMFGKCSISCISLNSSS